MYLSDRSQHDSLCGIHPSAWKSLAKDIFACFGVVLGHDFMLSVKMYNKEQLVIYSDFSDKAFIYLG